MPIALSILPGMLSICRLSADEAIPAWVGGGPFFSITRTEEELSVVCGSALVPAGVRAEDGWRALAVAGPLAFGLVGIVSDLSSALAAAGVSIFIVSTFDTDYVLVRAADLARAVEALRAAGHRVDGEGQDAD
ncbi:MAG TPA: ACT domain-containing protein [Vicinamibacterales bacterium]|nr:ACT domain-containing protein [Vicinamibacterales bacterium]